MIEDIVINLNLWKMTKGSNGLLVVPGEERSYSNAGFWSKDYPYYAIDFLFDGLGLIRKFGTVRNPPSQKHKRYSLGTFLVVVDMPSIRAMLERRYDNRNCPKVSEVRESALPPTKVRGLNRRFLNPALRDIKGTESHSSMYSNTGLSGPFNERKEDDDPAFPQERIVAVYSPEKTLERAVRRLEKTVDEYNARYGFDPDYNGFTV